MIAKKRYMCTWWRNAQKRDYQIFQLCVVSVTFSLDFGISGLNAALCDKQDKIVAFEDDY